MGILRGIAALMIEEHQARPFGGRLLQLGRQEIFFSAAQLARIAARRGFTPANLAALARIEDRDRELTDREFFEGFGFTDVAATDNSAFDAADLIYDMNHDDLPEAHRAAYDCVVDGGTMEHVFHVPNFLRNVFGLLRVGGRVVHVCPASNAVDHGFYSLSPCLFYEFYRVNGWRIDTCALLDFGTKLLPIRMTAYDYVPPISRKVLDGYLHGTVHYTFFVATKTAAARGDVVPQQNFYQDLWDDAARDDASSDQTTGGFIDNCKAAIKANPRIERVARRFGLPVLRAARIVRARRQLNRLARRVEI